MKDAIEVITRYYPVVLSIIVVLLDAITVYRIIRDTHTTSKTFAYILLVILVPFAGSIVYFSFGINYRKEKMFSKKIIDDSVLFAHVEERILQSANKIIKDNNEELAGVNDLIQLLLNDAKVPISLNKVNLLINGEEKFPEVFQELERAENFIHLEYYIVEEGEMAERLFDILMRKARQGVTVRFIYDDFGSRLRRKRIKTLRAAGVQTFPFYKIRILFLANRLNYRDHRKIIIIDGKVGFVGGINFSDKYINNGKRELFWRDTHLKIAGPAVGNLQYHFIANWNFCSGQKLEVTPDYFPISFAATEGEDFVQIVAGGPDYPRPSIMLSYFTAIVMAKQRVYITSPYFIPNDSIHDALIKAALSGKDVRLLLPGISDSRVVNAAARSYFKGMLLAGVKIYLYQKGFVHAKTIVVDDVLSMVGTANMDVRSFDLNFEINAAVYSKTLNSHLAQVFMEDLDDSSVLTLEGWLARGKWAEFVDSCARLFSPLL